MPSATERTFGFELEVADGANDLAAALTEAGVSRSRRRHQWHCRCEYCTILFGERGNWLKVQNDSSCGGEAISSILRWGNSGTIGGHSQHVNPQHLIDLLCDTMVDLDIPIDGRCGLHVHVGANDLTDNQLGRLYQLMHHYEAILYRLACGRSAQHRGYSNDFNYCRPMSGFDNPVEAQELAWLKSSQVKSSPIAYNKYIMANLVPIESLGTVEFRLWEATRSRRRLRLYAKLSVALVQRAKLRRRPVGTPLYLGAEADDGVLMDFLHDLQQAAPELVDDELIEDAMWQWGEGPAGWQPAVQLPPLPHHTFDGRVAVTAEDAERVTQQMDSHGSSIEVPWEYDLRREQRQEMYREQHREQRQLRPIPDHLRPSERGPGYLSDPNHDCGYGFCGHSGCMENRRQFWDNVDRGIVRDPNNEEAAPLPPAPRPRGTARPVRTELTPEMQNTIQRVAERARARLTEEMEAEPPFPVDPPEAEPSHRGWSTRILTIDNSREDTD